MGPPPEGHSLTVLTSAAESEQVVVTRWSSAGVEEARPEVLVDVFLADAERAPDAYGGQFPVVDQSVDGHLGDAHHRSHLGDGQELHLGDVVGGHCAPYFLLSHVLRLPRRRPKCALLR